MAIWLATIAVCLRIFSPHYVLDVAHLPLIPAVTGLMILAAGFDTLRRRVVLAFPFPLALQWMLFAWAGVTLLVNTGQLTEIVGSDYLKDLVFITVIVCIVDRVRRYKILSGSLVATVGAIGVLALPQIWGPRICGEYREGYMAYVKLDGRPCNDELDCYVKPPRERKFEGPGQRLFRCERRGPFGVAAYIGRSRWVGFLNDSNALGGTLAGMIPLLIGLYWRSPNRRWRLAWPALAAALAAGILATGSRGAQLATLAGIGVTVMSLLGVRAWIYGGTFGALGAIGLAVFGGVGVRESGRFQGDASVSDRYRRDAMLAGFRLWAKRPLFGVGYNQISPHYHVIGPHNSFLNAAADLGTVGLVGFTLGIWVLLKGMLSLWRHARSVGRRDIEQLALGTLGFDVATVTAQHLFLHSYDKLAWLLPISLNLGLLRAGAAEMEGFHHRFDYRDIVVAVAATVLILSGLYVALMVAYSVSD